MSSQHLRRALSPDALQAAISSGQFTEDAIIPPPRTRTELESIIFATAIEMAHDREHPYVDSTGNAMRQPLDILALAKPAIEHMIETQQLPFAFTNLPPEVTV